MPFAPETRSVGASSPRERDGGTRPRAARLLKRSAQAAAIAVAVLLLWFVVIPQFRMAWKELHRAAHLSLGLAACALALELMSLAAYGLLTHAVLPPAARPPRWTTIRVNLVGVAATNALPGGGPIAAALRLVLLGGRGRDYAGAAGGLAMELPLSGAVLGIIFTTGALTSLPLVVGGWWEALSALVVLGIFVCLAALIAMQRHRWPLRVIVVASRWLPAPLQRGTISFANRMSHSMAALAADRRRLAVAVAWAAGNWLLDAASLGLFLVAAGWSPSLPQLLLVHSLAAVLSLLSISPGGLGIVEGVLVPALGTLGAPASAALLGTVGWRLAQYWLPIALGVISGFSLAFRSSAADGASFRQRLSRLTTPS